MSGAEALYDQRIKALAALPAPAKLERADASARVDNPLCGDRAIIAVRLDAGRVAELSHEIRGCLICRASAGLAAKNVPGMTEDAAKRLGAALKDYLTGSGEAPAGGWDAFQPLRAHPGRHTCALLPLQALQQALEGGKF
jgi:nitrogen fixation NifU-like protein